MRRYTMWLVGGATSLSLLGCFGDPEGGWATPAHRGSQTEGAWAIDGPHEPAPDLDMTELAIAERATWSPDGRRVLIERDGELRLMDAHTGDLTPVPVKGAVQTTAISPRGDRLAVWTDTSLTVLRMHDGADVSVLDVDRDEPVATELVFSRNGQRIASNSGLVWDTRSGQLVQRLASEGYHVAWSDDARYVVSTGFRIQLLDVASGKEVLSDGGGCGGQAVSPNGFWVAFSISQHDLISWRLGGEPSTTILSARGCTNHHIHPYFTPDSRVLYATGGGLYGAYEPGSLRPVGFYEPPTEPGASETEEVVAVSPDGLRIVVRRVEETLFVWDAARLHKVTELPLAAGREVAGFSPDGRSLLTSGRGVVEILSAWTGERQLRVEHHTQ